MRRLLRRSAPRTAAARAPAARALAAAVAGPGMARWRSRPGWPAVLRPSRLPAGGALALVLAVGPVMYPPPIGPVPGGPASEATPTAHRGGVPFQRIVLPDVVVVAPHGLSAAQLAQLRKIRGARNVLAVDGARITLGGKQVNVIGVDPRLFRPWTPLRTASSSRLWSAVGAGRFVTAPQLRQRLHLHPGSRYRLAGATTQELAFGGSGRLGIAGIDVAVSNRASARLGLIHNVAALISAPGAGMHGLLRQARAVAGARGTVTDVRQQQLPQDRVAAGVRPTSYLDLFKQSAAEYCPGMSWTVLAAIGQIESGDGANMGPSSAGALGPMQFLPSTWARWGITAFGEPGPPNVMDPYDAVPSAARYLCAAGAGTPSGLPGAIYAYNHAGWYVRDVLALARQYADQYG